MSEFTEVCPTEGGEYEIKCAETNYRHERVIVELFNGSLWANDPEIGKYPLDLYHSNLVDLSWRKLEGDEISGCSDDQKFGLL